MERYVMHDYRLEVRQTKLFFLTMTEVKGSHGMNE